MKPEHPLCIFCNRRAFPPSKEDVLARWIVREFPRSTWSVERKFFYAPYRPQDVQTQRYTRRNKLLVSKKVCENCNNNWMSKLEDRAKIILAPMIHGQTTVLPEQSQLVIAQWLVKTIMAYEFLGGTERGPKFFSQTERHAFMQSLSIPDGILVFLASYRGGTHHILTRETRLDFVVAGREINSPLRKGDEVKGYAVTVTIKHLTLQLVSLRQPEDSALNATVFISGGWSDAELPIWPITSSFTWPPAFDFDDDGLELFVTRWRDSPDLSP